MSTATAPSGPAEASGRFFGVVAGVVTNLNDPQGLGRVKVKLAWLDDDAESTWARVMTPMAGAGRGLALPPEVGDEVLLAFEHGSLDAPYVLGGLWGSKDKPPPAVEQGKVKRRGLTSRAGHTIEIQEDEGADKGQIALTTAGGRAVVIADGDEGLIINSAKHTITLDDRTRAVSVEADGTLELTAGQCKLSFSESGVELSFSGGSLKISAQGVELASNSLLTVKASASLGLTCDGVTELKGSLVKIN